MFLALIVMPNLLHAQDPDQPQDPTLGQQGGGQGGGQGRGRGGRGGGGGGGGGGGRRAIDNPDDPNAQPDMRRSNEPINEGTFSALSLRNIGPAVTGGRVIAFAVDPTNRSRYYAGVASGGVWKTVNDGATWTPVFDHEGSYSIGAVVLDPKNPNTVWVGTGECNSQRSVSYGDGVYRSDNGGRSWRNMGLKASEHIGRIALDPRNSDTVYVAAQGPLWGPGGDRGLYKTTDGGKTWKKVLSISENTGVTDVAIDPKNPDIVYAAAYQRRRHVWTLIDGGPESALYKSTDAGATWNRLNGGLPGGDVGRIGISISPVDSHVVYAIVEGASRRGGIFRSDDYGANWEKRNPFDQTAMYYAQIIADPKNVDRVYVLNTINQVSDDGGRTLRPVGERDKHVDNHALWIDPNDTDYLLAGCDGGIYESYDRGATWLFKSNLSIAQFYDVTVDNAAPFYNVYGGTQDNGSLGGPSRTRSRQGIVNSDWFITTGGDGFYSQVDPQDPMIVYAESQEGGLVRFDRRANEHVDIRPQESKGEPPLRWDWDAPLIVSPYLHTRLYFAANKLYRSDDRGDSWRPISPDLTRQIDRNKLPVMGKIWSIDAVAKHASTSFFGNGTTISESPVTEGLIYVGTDDGLIQVTEDGGANWRKIDRFPGVPDMTYVSKIVTSQHAAKTVYAAFDNHKMSDFAPYLLKSDDAGKTWTSIKGDLPTNGPVLAIAEDHVNPKLLFVGTEFGLFFTLDGGTKWIPLRSGLPTIAVHDLAIQRRENDLVVATFGRGIYILDDYTPIRIATPDMFKQTSFFFPIKDALAYIPSGGAPEQGTGFFTASNPPFGATITYFVKDTPRNKRQLRQEAERTARRTGATPPYPTIDQLREESEEPASSTIVTISDTGGNVIRRFTEPAFAGVHRLTWDLRLASSGGFGSGPLVVPGKYNVTLAQRVDGVLKPLPGTGTVNVVLEGIASMSNADREKRIKFFEKAERLQAAISASVEVCTDIKTRLDRIRSVLTTSTSARETLWAQVDSIDHRVSEIQRALSGDPTPREYNEPSPPSISERIGNVAFSDRSNTSLPTKTQTDSFTIASAEFSEQLKALRALVHTDMAKLEKQLDNIGAPWTPGRLPDWNGG